MKWIAIYPESYGLTVKNLGECHNIDDAREKAPPKVFIWLMPENEFRAFYASCTVLMSIFDK